MNDMKKNTSRQLHDCKKALFLKWLTEWRDEAVKNDMRTKHSYAKVSR